MDILTPQEKDVDMTEIFSELFSLYLLTGARIYDIIDPRW